MCWVPRSKWGFHHGVSCAKVWAPTKVRRPCYNKIQDRIKKVGPGKIDRGPSQWGLCIMQKSLGSQQNIISTKVTDIVIFVFQSHCSG